MILTEAKVSLKEWPEGSYLITWLWAGWSTEPSCDIAAAIRCLTVLVIDSFTIATQEE